MNIKIEFVFIILIINLMIPISVSAACGDYDPTTALEYGRLYQEALRAKDYDRLKELRTQRAQSDLWAKTNGECESGDPNEDRQNSSKMPIYESVITANDINFNCEWYDVTCKGTQTLCKNWIQENNNETGYEWLNRLPACPCSSQLPQDKSTLDDWAFASGDEAVTQKFHPGATGGCYRSPGINAGYKKPSAQQCCYDSNNSLITSGAAAGTPDLDAADGVQISIPDVPWVDIIEADEVVITEQAEIGHPMQDVVPFKTCGWEIYNQVRQPNNANSCPANTI